MERDEAELKRRKFASTGSDADRNMSSSTEDQKNMCCTNLAMSVYTKAWEGAKKAIPTKIGSGTETGSSFPRSSGGNTFESLSPRSIDSDGSGGNTEASFDYDDYNDCEDLGKDFKTFAMKNGSSSKNGRKESNRKKSELLTEQLSSQSESELEFPEEKGSPDDIDLEKFKAKYLSGKIGPVEDEIKKDAKEKESEMIKFARKTSHDVLKSAGDELKSLTQKPAIVVEVVKGDGIFKKHHQEIENKKKTSQVKKEVSTESSFDSYSVDLPTITITEDTLHDTISQSTLRGSVDDVGDLPPDHESLSKMSTTDTIRSKVKEIGFKVKDIFSSSHPDDPVSQEELMRKKIKKEEELKRKREDELRKKELELVRRELEMKKKEEDQKRKDEEKARKQEEHRLKKEESERLKKDAEFKKKEEEQRRKEELLHLKEVEIDKKRMETESKLLQEKEALKAEAEKMKQKVISEKIDTEIKKEGLKIDQALREAQEIDKRLQEQHDLMSKKKKVPKVAKVSTTRGERTKTETSEEGALEVDRSLTVTSAEDLHDFDQFMESTDPITSEFVTVASSSDTVNAGGGSNISHSLSMNQSQDTLVERWSESPEKHQRQTLGQEKKKKKQQSKLGTIPSFDTESVETQPRLLVRSNTGATVTDDELFIAIESEGGYSERGIDVTARRKKKMTKKIRDTKNRLKSMTNKALEASVASMQTIKSKVTDMFGRPGTSDHSPYGSVKNRRDQMYFSEYRDRLPDDEFFSDSEVVESRKDTFRKNEVMRLLKERNEPIRPPRPKKFREGSQMDIDDFPEESGQKSKLYPASSDPNLSSRPALPKPGFRSKRPPRPPLPSARPSEERTSVTTAGSGGSATVTASSGPIYQMVDISLEGPSCRSSIDRSESLRLPRSNAREYYLSIRREWRQKHPPRILKPSRIANEQLKEVSTDRNVVSEKPPAAPRRKMTRRSVDTPTGTETGPISVIDRSATPTAPPRKRRGQSTERRSVDRASLSSYSHSRLDYPNVQHPYFPADHYPRSSRASSTARAYGNELSNNPLHWKPFSWKTGRCRSLTELYIQKQSLIYSNDEADFEGSLRYKLTTQYCIPTRPQPPEYENIPSHRPPIYPRIQVTDEPIYSVVRKKIKKGDIIQDRPLPNLPPHPHQTFSSRDNTIRPSSSSARSRSASPFDHRDAAVSTRDDDRSKTLEREVQTSLEDISSIRTEGLRSANMNQDPRFTGDVNANFPVPPLTANPLVLREASNSKKTSGDEMSSSRTYYDAESDQDHHDEEHFDQDTFAGLDSIAADLTSTSTVGTSSHYMSLHTPTPTFDPPKVERDEAAVEKRTSSLERSPRPLTPTVRSTSSSRPLAMGIAPIPTLIGRRTGKIRTGAGTDDDDLSEDDTDLVDLAAELQRELKEKVAKRVSQEADAEKDWDKDW